MIDELMARERARHAGLYHAASRTRVVMRRLRRGVFTLAAAWLGWRLADGLLGLEAGAWLVAALLGLVAAVALPD